MELRRAGAGTGQAETGRREGQTLGGPRELAERVGAGARGPLGAASSRRPVPRRPRLQPPQPPLSSPPPATAPSPLAMSSERRFLQSAFEVAPRLWADLAPGQGGRARGWGGI